MKVKCKFTLEYSSNEIAKKIKAALEVDNSKFVKTELKGEKLIAHMESGSVMSLLHTTEDYLACLATAEQVIIQTKEQLDKDLDQK